MADSFLALLEKEKPSIQAMLPDSEDRERWWALAYELSRNSPLREVAEKNPMSLINAIKKFANWGLVPDGEDGFINVYNVQRDGAWVPEASPEAMYKGMIRRAVDAGIIVHAVADVLRDGDTIEESIGRDGRILKVNRSHGKKGRKLSGAYALFWLPNGLMDYELFEEEDIEAVEKAALRNAQRRKKDATLSPAWQFFRGEQSKKSVLKRGLKRMRGKRYTDAGRRFSEMVAENTRYDVETTAQDPPEDDLPTPRTVEVVRDADGAGRVESSHAGSEHVSKEAGSAPLSSQSATSRSGGAETDPLIGDEGKTQIEMFCNEHKIKLGVQAQALYDYAQLEDFRELRATQLPGFLQHLEKFC